MPSPVPNYQKGLKSHPPFSTENQPANRGRKPSQLKKFISDNNLTHADVGYLIKHILPLSKKQLSDLLIREDTPFLIRLFIKGMMQDMKTGDLRNIMALLDRVYGKPVTHSEISGVTPPLFIGFATLEVTDAVENTDTAPPEN